MLGNLLAIVKGDGSSWAGQTKDSANYYFDNFGEPLLYALIGLLVVFAGIIIIICVIQLVGLINRKFTNEEAAKEPQPIIEEVKAEKAVAADTSDEVPDEVKAAIVAAIMAYYSANQEKCEFTVKRIKRIHGGN